MLIVHSMNLNCFLNGNMTNYTITQNQLTFKQSLRFMVNWERVRYFKKALYSLFYYLIVKLYSLIELTNIFNKIQKKFHSPPPPPPSSSSSSATDPFFCFVGISTECILFRFTRCCFPPPPDRVMPLRINNINVSF